MMVVRTKKAKTSRGGERRVQEKHRETFQLQTTKKTETIWKREKAELQ